MACSQATWPERTPHRIEAAVDKALFWPTKIRYIADGDTAVLLFQGLRRGFACSRVLELNTEPLFVPDTALRLRDSVELPADAACPLDAKGLDTILKMTTAFLPGTLLHLQTPDGSSTDSARMVAATLRTVIGVRVIAPESSALSGRFIVRDSTAAHPLRTVESDSLPPCETLYGAAYTRNADTLQVVFRILVLDSARHANLPPCLGIHSDTAEIAPDRFGLPR